MRGWALDQDGRTHTRRGRFERVGGESPIHHPFTRFQTHVTWLHVEGQRAGERMGAGSGWAGADHTHAWRGRLSFERVGGESPIHHPFTRFQTHVTWLRVKGQHAGWAGAERTHTRMAGEGFVRVSASYTMRKRRTSYKWG